MVLLTSEHPGTLDKMIHSNSIHRKKNHPREGCCRLDRGKVAALIFLVSTEQAADAYVLRVGAHSAVSRASDEFSD
jgi:hypothetical protein